MNQAFIKHFNLNVSEIQDAQSHLAPGQTMLDYLFEKKWVEPQAYIEWAKDFYGLPILRIEFLEKNNQIENLLTRYRNVFPKNVVPFYEWDGVLYVLCLEPVAFQAPQTVQYILAPYDIIQKYSMMIEVKPETEVAALDIQEKLEQTNTLFKNLSAHKETAEPMAFSFDLIKMPGDNSPTSSVAEPTSLLEPMEPEVSAEEKSEDGEEKISDEVVEMTGAPAGLDFPDLKTETPEFVTNRAISAVDLKNMKLDDAAAKMAAPMTPPPPLTPPKIVKTTPPPLDMPMSFELTQDVPPAKLERTPTAQVKPAAPSLAESMFGTVREDSVTKPIVKEDSRTRIVDLDSLKNSPSVSPPKYVREESVVEVREETVTIAHDMMMILGMMKKHFNQSMIFSAEENVLTPVLWDASWTKKPHTQSAIDLTSPSIFRIVKETLKSYHGYVVANTINDAFFQTWNKGDYPEHVTICPIYKGKILVGMILGTATKVSAKKFQLHHIEEIANHALSIMRTKAAAA